LRVAFFVFSSKAPWVDIEFFNGFRSATEFIHNLKRLNG